MSLESILPFLLMFAVVYLFMIRPQLQKQKKEKKFLTSLKKGDKVVTKSGLHGKVMEINEDQTLVIETGAGKLKFESSSISMEMSANLNK